MKKVVVKINMFVLCKMHGIHGNPQGDSQILDCMKKSIISELLLNLAPKKSLGTRLLFYGHLFTLSFCIICMFVNINENNMEKKKY